MLKKILIAVGILAVLGIVGIVFVGNKIDSAIKAREPEFRQYVTMTVEEQNAYVEKNIESFMQMISKEADTQGRAVIEKIKTDPELKTAAIDLGRSIVATFILANEDILKDLSTEVHNSLKSEAEQMDSRNNRFHDIIEKYIPKEK